MKTPTLLFLMILLTSFASGCGGGGSGDDNETIICNDGWVSNSKGEQGACSSHGGVKK